MKSVFLLVVASGALLAAAGPHNLLVARHHAIAARAPVPVAADDPVPLRRRCKQRPPKPTPTPLPAPNPAPKAAIAYQPASTPVPPTPTPTGTLHSGDGTFFFPGLGACGITNSETDLIVAISHEVFDKYPGNDGNSNHNPVCGKQIKAIYEGNSVVVTVTDRCADASCLEGNLDFSPSAFDQLAPRVLGRLRGVEWYWV